MVNQPIHIAGGGMRRILLVLALLALSFSVAADDKTAELQRLHVAVSSLNQEQQTLFQQFQMLQELRRTNDRATYATQLGAPQNGGEVPIYADVVQAQKDSARRGEDLAQQADQIYAQYTEIGAKKAQLQQRIFELSLSK
jgi:hypothetical protein